MALFPIFLFKRSTTPPLTCQFRNFFCGRASFFGVFQGKNIPLIVPALDCRSDAGSALGTSKARQAVDFFGPPSAAFRYALKKKFVKKTGRLALLQAR